MLTPKIDLRTGRPLWISQPFSPPAACALQGDKNTDVVIIGAGITGALAAQALASAGFEVMLLDRRGPLKGATSATTALLQYEIDTPLIKLQKQIGKDDAARAWRRSKLALESIGATIQSLDIACDAMRRPSLYLAGNVLNAEALKQECQARNAIGLYTDYCSRIALLEKYSIRRSAALRSFDNLTVNPLLLAAGLLKDAAAKGAAIFAPVTAERIEPGKRTVKLYTADGPVIRARYVIYATGYEIPKSVTATCRVHSTYAIATQPQPDKLWPEECMIWEASDPYLYLRTTPDGRVICGGADAPFENEKKRDALLVKKTALLERKLGALFPALDSKAEFAWCGSFGTTPTGLPMIGKIPGMPRCFAILAFGGNGITFGRIAADVLAAELTGRPDPDADLFAFK